MWVLEDRFAAGRPAWEHGGAVFTDDVEPYELLKLRLLNGTHSLIAYLGALDGRATIPERAAQPFIADAARRVLYDEYLPSRHRARRRRPRRLRGPALRALVQHRARAPHPAGRLRRLGQARPAGARTGPPAAAGGQACPTTSP